MFFYMCFEFTMEIRKINVLTDYNYVDIIGMFLFTIWCMVYFITY